MPTRKELAGINTKKANNCYLDPIFVFREGGCYMVWSDEKESTATAWYFQFATGKEGWGFLAKHKAQAFGVRSR